jgi:GNAT superfamily N-acetyltransferase
MLCHSKFTTDKFPSSKEEISTHFLLRLTPSLKPIGTIRGYPVSGTADTYKLTRLAVLKDYRRYGFGRKLVDALHTWVETRIIPPSPSAPEAAIANGKPTASKSNKNTSSQSYPAQPLKLTRQIIVISHSQIYAKGFYAKYVYI